MGIITLYVKTETMVFLRVCEQRRKEPEIMKKILSSNFFSKVSMVFLTTALLLGCSSTDVDIAKLTDKNDKQSFDYEVPTGKPSILVNQLGYYPKSVKTAIFTGDNVPESFAIVDAKNDEEVYIGKIEHKGYREDLGLNISIGTFTDFTKEGEYYLLCDTIGQSYKFSISNIMYDTLLDDLLKEISGNRWQEFHTNTEELYEFDNENAIEVSGGWYTSVSDTEKVRDVKTGCETVINLLMSAELYMDEHSDAVGITESGNEIPDILDEVAYEVLWLLKMQDNKTGAVYSALTEKNGELVLSETDMETCQNFIIAMAKFSYTMKKYDSAFATECLRASDATWKYVESIKKSQKEEDKNMQDKMNESLRFFGAAELFRASGAYRYHAVIKEYVPNTYDESKWTKADYLGIYTYLASRTGVSKSICEEWMKQIMDIGEKIASESKKTDFMTVVSDYDENCQNLLWKMTIMTSIDYIIGNHEYDTILESSLHYLLGRNVDAYSYIDGYGNDEYLSEQKLSISNDLTKVSELMFILSEIVSNQ